MEKIVASGEQDCTVELDGTECAVVFSSNYKCFTVQNETADDIYISVSPNISAGKDGVKRIGAGASGAIAHGAKNTLYILGSGSVQVTASDSPGNFFKPAPAQSGGEAVDAYTKTESDDKYAQKTDVVPYKMGMDFGTCTTTAETVIKSVTTLHKVAPALGAVFAVKFTYGVPASAILNVNNLTGYVQYKGSRVKAGIIGAGDVVTFMYHSSGGVNCFEILSIENGGNAKTVNGFTVGCNVPADAVLTPPDLSGYAKLTDIPSSLPANGGNADTLDGRHASEFAVSLTNLQFGSNRIEIPDGVNVGEWLVENAKSGNLYFIASRASRTNLPNVSADWMWFSYDGNRYFARAWTGNTDTTEFILNTVNSVGEWKEIYTSDNKPYVTGTASYTYSTEMQTFNVLNFTPSFVIIRHGQRYSSNGTLIYGTPITNGFQAVIDDQTTTTLTYIAFK